MRTKLTLFLALASMAACASPVMESTVYRTKTGEKYHKSSCRYLKKSKIEITLSAAKDRGLSACSVCKPPKQ